jgi:hypothetical protein
VVTGSADGGKSVVEVPKRPLYADICYAVVLRTVDRLGNRCDRSTATVTARLLPSITGGKLPDGQSPIIEVDDMEDGTRALMTSDDL